MKEVALKPVTACGWSGCWRPVKHQFSHQRDSLEEAREAYDAGLVELVQGRRRDEQGRLWVVLYSIRRKKRRETHLNYFSGPVMSMVRSA